jgi:Mitochondrial pyruvate carriers
MQITPVNYNLLAVNLAMAATGITQLTRKLRHDYGMDTASEAQQTTESLHMSKECWALGLIIVWLHTHGLLLMAIGTSAYFNLSDPLQPELQLPFLVVEGLLSELSGV